MNNLSLNNLFSLDSYLYYSAIDNAENKGAIWRLTLSNGESTWVIAGTVLSLAVFLKVDTNRFFFAGEDTDPVNDGKHIFAVLEWDNPTLIWQNLRSITGSIPYSRLQRAQAVLSEDKQKVYCISGQDR